MAEITQRLSNESVATSLQVLRRRVKGCLADLDADAFGRQDPERIQAAMVLASDRKWEPFMRVFRLLTVDWRDLLVAGGLADGDWPALLNVELPDS